MKALQTILVAFAIIIAIGGFAVWRGGWGAIAPSHPALAGSGLPPLISVGDFFANTAADWDYQPSPGGKWLSWGSVDRLAQVLKYRPLKGGDTRIIRHAQGAFHFWANDDSALYLGQYEAKLQRGVLWKIDPQNPSAQWQDVSPRGLQDWYIVHRPKDGGGPWLISSRDRLHSASDLYTFNPDGSGKKLLFHNDGTIADLYFDVNGAATSRLRKLGPDRFAFERLASGAPFADNAEWRGVFDYSDEDNFRVVTKEKDGAFYALSARNREFAVLVRVNVASGEEAVVAAQDGVDVWRPYVLSDEPEVDIAEFADGYRQYRPLTELGQKTLDFLDAADGPIEIDMLGASSNGEYSTFAVSRREDSWEYWLIDTLAGKAEKLGQYDFVRHKSYLADTKPVDFASRDGLRIPALLTFPHGVEAKNLPAIVYVHGGPSSHEQWGYNHEIQFLANRGYAVLSVNFRGSTGYGKAFRRAGFRQFGRAMQDDIADAAKWLAAEGLVDSKKIAVLGTSYGGYAAMMAMARDAGLFAAGVSIVGATDIEYQSEHAPLSWGLHIAGWTSYFGSIDSEADRREMREYSPVNHVAKIAAPVLLAHGVLDRVVDRAQSEAFEAQLKELGKTYEAHYYEKEGHGFRRWQTRVKFHRRLEDFLARTLGGRSGGFHYSEIGAAFL